MSIRAPSKTLFSGTAIYLILTAHAHAAGTASGTTITNTASVGYSVGGVAQNAVPSNAANFVVDKKVNMTVAESTGATSTVDSAPARR